MSKKPKPKKSKKPTQHEEQASVQADSPVPLASSPWFPDPRRLLAAIDTFLVDLNAFTDPLERGRVVLSPEAGTALSRSHDVLQSEVLRAQGILTGPRTILCAGDFDLGTLPRRAGPDFERMQAALRSVQFFLAVPAERASTEESTLAANFYQSGDIITSVRISQLEASRRMLETLVPEPERPEWEKLSDTQTDCLQALKDLGALSEATHRKARAVAKSIGMPPDSVKKPLADLVSMGLVGSKPGRGGGSWLTPKGLAVINLRRPPGT